MGIGVGIFMMAVGAILSFAVEWEPPGISLEVVGWILMIAGALSVLLELLVFGPRRRRAVVTERRVYDDEPPSP